MDRRGFPSNSGHTLANGRRLKGEVNMPCDIDRQEAQEALERSLQYRRQKALGFIHYECGEIGKSRCVHAIAVKVLSTVETQLFSAERDEVKSLKGFAEYMAEYSSDAHLWCVWGMRNENYGFPHLNARLRDLTAGKISVPTPGAILDLSNICWQIHGDIDTGGKHRLPYLCEVNSIPTQGIVNCQTIQDALKNGQWPTVEASVLRKVEMIYALWDRMAKNKLVVRSAEAPGKRRSRGRPKASEEERKQRARVFDGWKTREWKDMYDLAQHFDISVADAKRKIDAERKARNRLGAKRVKAASE